MKPSVNFAVVIQLLLLAEAVDAKPNLHELVRAGDKQAVSAALPSRKIDKLDKKGNAPIHYAAAAANAGITELLLIHGADPSVSNKRYETTPLHEVARSNTRSARSIRETLTALLRYGADLWVTDTHGETPLMAASRAGNAVVVNAIVSHETVGDEVLANALSIAREHSRYSVIRLLESRGIQSAAGMNDGLLSATARGRFAVVDSLVRGGADVNARNENGSTPLIVAAENDHPALMIFLLDHGANVNSSTTDGMTALHVAASRGDRNMVDTLIERGADINAESAVHGTPLNSAAGKENVTIVNHLLANDGTPMTVEGGAGALFGSGLGWLMYADFHEESTPAETTVERRETAATLLEAANAKFADALEENEKLRKRKRRAEAITDALAVAVATVAVIELEKMRQDQIRANQRQTARIVALSHAQSHDDYFRRVHLYENAMINPQLNRPFQIDFDNTALTNRESITGLDVAISEYERRIALTNKLLQSTGAHEAPQGETQ